MNTMDEKRTDKWAIVALACTVLLLFVPNYSQYQLSPLAHLVMPTYGLDSAQFSMLFSAAMIPGILFSLVAGLLCDRFGVKRVVGIAGIISTLALVARVFAPSFGALFACMMLAGLLATFLNTNVAKIMGSWFPPEKVSLAVGIGLTGPTLSMVIGMGTSAFFPSLQTIFVFTAVVAVLAIVAWWMLFKDGPRGVASDDVVQVAADDAAADHAAAAREAADPAVALEAVGAISAAQPSLSECLKVVLKSRNVWLLGIALGLDMAATMCILTFLPQVLQSTRGFDPTVAGALSSVVTFGNGVGSILAPMIYARVGRFKPVVIVIAIVAGAGTAFAWQLPEGLVMMVCFFLTGFSLGGLLVLLVAQIVLLPEIGPVYAGTAGGVGATLQLFGAVVIPSYILMPILGANYPVLYGIAGILCLVIVACVLPLPRK